MRTIQQKSLATEVIDGIIRLGVVEKAIHEGDATIFVWAANAEEQIDALLSELLANRIKRYAVDPKSQTLFNSMLMAGALNGDTDPEILKRALASFALEALDIEIPKQ